MGDKYNPNGLTCIFTKEAGEAYGSAQLFDINKREIAHSLHLEKPLVNRWLFSGGGAEYSGDSIQPFEHSKNLNENMYNMALATKDDGFSVVIGKHSAADKNDGECNVKLADGTEFKNVPMKISVPSGMQ